MSGASPERSENKLRIGVDLGGTKIEFVALEADGRELQRFRHSQMGSHPHNVGSGAGGATTSFGTRAECQLPSAKC